MISLGSLPKIATKKKKRIGRGYGSGVGGHTTIRGSKGMKARGKVPLTFDGSKIKKSWLKKLPFLRGKGRFNSPMNPIAINIGQMDRFKKGSKVDKDFLVKQGLIKKKDLRRGVKVLGSGSLTKALKVCLKCSRIAKEKIIKVGGKVENE